MRTKTMKNYFVVITRDNIAGTAWAELIGTDEQIDYMTFDSLAEVEKYINGKVALNYLDDESLLNINGIKSEVLGIYNILTDDVFEDLPNRVTKIIFSRY